MAERTAETAFDIVETTVGDIQQAFETGQLSAQLARARLFPRGHQADKVIMILPKVDWPDYLVESDKVILWDLPDPVDTNHDEAWTIFDEIGVRIRALVGEIG